VIENCFETLDIDINSFDTLSLELVLVSFIINPLISIPGFQRRFMSLSISYIDFDDKSSISKYQSELDVSKSVDASQEAVTSSPSKLCIHTNKASSGFVTVFDGVLSDEWCDFAYALALNRFCKPWGEK
jgi:hypothetical protein